MATKPSICLGQRRTSTPGSRLGLAPRTAWPLYDALCAGPCPPTAAGNRQRTAPPPLPVMQVPEGTTLFREHEARQASRWYSMARCVFRAAPAMAASWAVPACCRMDVPGVIGLPVCGRCSARGITCPPTRLSMLPLPSARPWASEPFRDFCDGPCLPPAWLTSPPRIEAVAFQKLDSRLPPPCWATGSQLRATHQAPADELGTVREIVTRLLHRFERSGWVSCHASASPSATRGLRQLAAQELAPRTHSSPLPATTHRQHLRDCGHRLSGR